jgi:hypothetical protein
MNLKTRNGKIARLPQAVREELNQRLQNGESGTSLCAWLHSLPEVQAVLRREFGGRPINAQNLTEWRYGGYAEWLAADEARALARDLGHEMLAEPEESRKVPTEMLALSLAGQYLIATRLLREERDPKEEWRLLREMTSDVAKLRNAELSRKRLELQQRLLTLQSKDLEFRKACAAAVSAAKNSKSRSPE